jgi:hypothetical protein
LMFQERVAVTAPKLNMSWTLLGVWADDGRSRYTEVIKGDSIKCVRKYLK